MLLLDFPGNGLLNQQNSLTRVFDMVQDCRAQLARMGLCPPYHLLALSLGGMVAVAWAHAHPQEFARQVLINTSMRPFNPFHQRLRAVNYPTLLKLILFNASAQQWEHAVLRMTSRHQDASVIAQWLTLRQANPVSSRNAFRQLLAAARFSAPLGPPQVPTLLLAAKQDQLVSVKCSQSLARHWHCALRLHPSAGHDIPLDDGLWVIQQIQQWVIKMP